MSVPTEKERDKLRELERKVEDLEIKSEAWTAAFKEFESEFKDVKEQVIERHRRRFIRSRDA